MLNLCPDCKQRHREKYLVCRRCARARLARIESRETIDIEAVELAAAVADLCDEYARAG